MSIARLWYCCVIVAGGNEMHLARPPQNQGTLEAPNMRVAALQFSGKFGNIAFTLHSYPLPLP